MNKEQWRPIVGYSGLYEVSNLGRVRNLWYRNRNAHMLLNEPRNLTPSPSGRKGRYLHIGLHRNNQRKMARVHELVLSAFVGPRPDGFDGGHLDNNGHNNVLSNLKWITVSENAAHRWIHGTVQNGEKNRTSKLTWENVKDIRSLKQAGFSTRTLAKKFHISETTIRYVVRGDSWTGKPKLKTQHALREQA